MTRVVTCAVTCAALNFCAAVVAAIIGNAAAVPLARARLARRAQVLALAALALFGLRGAALAQTAPSPPPASAAAVPFAMTFGDMMNTLIQPRHAKLGLAGAANNWPLAGYAVAELRQSFAGIVKATPKFRGLPVGELVDAAVSAPLTALETAVRQQDAQKFAAAYEQLTQGCNACHMELDHPFVVIKAPDAAAFPDQDFRPRQ